MTSNGIILTHFYHHTTVCLLIILLSVVTTFFYLRCPPFKIFFERLWSAKIPTTSIVILAILIAVFLSFPHWIFGKDSSLGNADDVTLLQHTYLSSSQLHGAINWCRSILGGTDRLLLANASPFSLAHWYTMFLNHWMVSSLIIIINIILVFVFSWKIQVKLWGMDTWVALFGSLTAVMLQGLWAGKFPDAHISNGHGLAIIPAIIYFLHRYQNHRNFLLVVLAAAAIFAAGSWIPFHNLPPLLLSILIWGLLFYRPKPWSKIALVFCIFLIVIFLFHFNYIATLAALMKTFARAASMMKGAKLDDILSVWSLRLHGLLIFLLVVLGLFKDRMVLRIFGLYCGFIATIFLAFLIQKSQLMPSYRWELLYCGNAALPTLAGFFLFNRIWQRARQLNVFAGMFLFLASAIVTSMVLLLAVLNSIHIDLLFSYKPGGWSTLTNDVLIQKLKNSEKSPFRIIAKSADVNIHLWGEYGGLESALGYFPFIDKRKTDFWFKRVLGYAEVSSGALYMSADVDKFGNPILPSLQRLLNLNDMLDLKLLGLLNVKYIVSNTPFLNDPDLDFFYAQTGQPIKCSTNPTFYDGIDPAGIANFISNINCIVHDYRSPRPFYIYRLKESLERAYFASPVKDGSIEITDYTQDRISLKIQTPEKAVVILSETNNPYWKLIVNGRQTDYFTVNSVQTGFSVDPGESQAVFVYCPPLRWHKDRFCR